jgi:hypothetical protein
MARTKIVLRSIGAFAAAIIVTSALSYGTDAVLIATGVMSQNALPESALVVACIVLYRTLYNVVGAFVLAKLAPKYPMRHAIALGMFGVVGSLAAISALGETSHAWYGWVLTAFVLPSVWLGVKLAERKVVK